MTMPVTPRVVFGRPGVVLPAGTYARLRPIDATTIAFESSYDALLVQAFKDQIPPSARRWDKNFKRWLVDPAYAAHCATLVEQYFGLKIAVPAVPGQARASLEQRLIKVEYLGRCKERALGAEATATGFADGSWSVIFPESVLRAWFEPTGQAEDDEAKTGKPATLYAVLMVTQQATADELRAAYRRLARSTHPDVNKEPDAHERFIALQAAYAILSDEAQRQRYDVGLMFEEQAKERDPFIGEYREYLADYAPPLRCGYVFASGRSRLGVFEVEQILQWESIVNDKGQELVTSWPKGGQHFVSVWVDV